MSQKTKVVKDETITDVSILREGDEVAFSVQVVGATTINDDATLTMTMYKVGTNTDVSSTFFTGTMTATNDTATTKTTTSLKAGEYTVSLKGTVDGQLYVFATIPIIVKRRGEI